MRRIKATQIYRRSKNLRAVQLLLGHAKLGATAQYLGIEDNDALEVSKQTEIRGCGRCSHVQRAQWYPTC